MIYFREVKEPYYSDGEEVLIKYWHVEYYDDTSIDGGKMFPVGVAYVVELPNQSTELQYVVMADQWRGRGFAKKLVSAAKERWPELNWKGATSVPGAAVLESAGLIDSKSTTIHPLEDLSDHPKT